MINKLPCITTKCILYPACKHKAVISCELLFNWLIRQGHSNETWVYINKFLTEIYTLIADRSWFDNNYEWPEKYYINQNFIDKDTGGIRNLTK